MAASDISRKGCCACLISAFLSWVIALFVVSCVPTQVSQQPLTEFPTLASNPVTTILLIKITLDGSNSTGRGAVVRIGENYQVAFIDDLRESYGFYLTIPKTLAVGTRYRVFTDTRLHDRFPSARFYTFIIDGSDPYMVGSLCRPESSGSLVIESWNPFKGKLHFICQTKYPDPIDMKYEFGPFPHD